MCFTQLVQGCEFGSLTSPAYVNFMANAAGLADEREGEGGEEGVPLLHNCCLPKHLTLCIKEGACSLIHLAHHILQYSGSWLTYPLVLLLPGDGIWGERWHLNIAHTFLYSSCSVHCLGKSAKVQIIIGFAFLICVFSGIPGEIGHVQTTGIGRMHTEKPGKDELVHGCLWF